MCHTVFNVQCVLYHITLCILLPHSLPHSLLCGCMTCDITSLTSSSPSHSSPTPRRDPLAQFDVEKREHEMKMKKMEQEMEEVFEMKVQEKLQKLRDIEADVSV